jgi:hypothetical protein
MLPLSVLPIGIWNQHVLYELFTTVERMAPRIDIAQISNFNFCVFWKKYHRDSENANTIGNISMCTRASTETHTDNVGHHDSTRQSGNREEVHCDS